jgi:hypothetical protein
MRLALSKIWLATAYRSARELSLREIPSDFIAISFGIH